MILKEFYVLKFLLEFNKIAIYKTKLNYWSSAWAVVPAGPWINVSKFVGKFIGLLLKALLLCSA